MLKRLILIVAALLVLVAPAFPATYVLQPDGSVVEQKADCPKSCDCGCQNGERCLCTEGVTGRVSRASAAAALAMLTIGLEPQAGVVCNQFGCFEVASPAMCSTLTPAAPTATVYSTSYAATPTMSYSAASEPRFPRLARFRGRLTGHAPTFTRTYAVAAPVAMAQECAPATFAPVPVETAKAMPLGAQPVKLVRVGGHFVNADTAEKLKAAGFSWLDIVQLVLKYGPQILEDILKLIGK